jgi:hypothetical protein
MVQWLNGPAARRNGPRQAVGVVLAGQDEQQVPDARGVGRLEHGQERHGDAREEDDVERAAAVVRGRKRHEHGPVEQHELERPDERAEAVGVERVVPQEGVQEPEPGRGRDVGHGEPVEGAPRDAAPAVGGEEDEPGQGRHEDLREPQPGHRQPAGDPEVTGTTATSVRPARAGLRRIARPPATTAMATAP